MSMTKSLIKAFKNAVEYHLKEERRKTKKFLKPFKPFYMTLVKFKQKPFEQNFNNWMDDFFTPFSSINRADYNPATFKTVPVNVLESENGYQLQVVAPGFEKDAFKIDLDKNLLTISAEVKKEEAESKEKVLRNEYGFKSFKRSFTLDEKIDAENIAAEYKNGVLTLNLPRKVEVKAAVKNITVQ